MEPYLFFFTLSFLVGLGIGIIFSRKAYGFFLEEIKTDLRHIRNEVDHMRIDVSYFTEGHGPSLTHDHEPSAVHNEGRPVADNEETLDTLRQQMREAGINTDTIDAALDTINSVSNRISNIGRSLRFPGLEGLGGGTSYSYTSFYHGPARNVPNQLPDPPSEIPINERRQQSQQTTNPEHPELDL